MGKFFSFIFLVILHIQFAYSENGVSNDKIILGGTADKSGASQVRTKALEKGSRLYFDKINKQGGISGRKIEWIVYDDQNEGKKMVDLTTQLIEKDRVFALFQPYGSLFTKVALKVIEKHNIPVIAPITGVDYRKNPVAEVFSIRPGFQIDSQTIIEFLVKEKKIQKIGVFNQSGGPAEMGSVGRTAIIEAIRNHGLQVAGAEAKDVEDLNLDAVAENFQKQEAKAITLWTRDSHALALIKACHKRGYKPIFVGGTPVATRVFLDGVTALDPALEVYLSQPVPTVNSPESPLIKSFIADAKEAKFGQEEYTPSEIEGYFNAMFMIEVIKKMGTVVNREKLFATLNSIENIDVGGIKINLNKNRHTGVDSSFIFQVKDRALHPISKK